MKNRLRAILHSEESILFLLDTGRYRNCQFSILCYCHGVGKITYGPLCYTVALNGCYKSRNIGILSPGCAKKNCAMLHTRYRYPGVVRKSVICDSALCNSV
jgi:hypothetical protein